MRCGKWLLAVAVMATAATVHAAPDEGDKAPSIKAPEWMNLPEGMKGISPTDLKGRVVMVEFWATW